MKPWTQLFRTKVIQQANVFNTTKQKWWIIHQIEIVDHSRFRCLKIAFDYSGLASIFKTTYCRDSQNPEHIDYQLSVTWCNSKTKKCWKKSICHKKLSKLFQANCRLWLPKAMTGLPKATRLTGVSPCLRTDYGHIHWHRIWKLMSNKLAMGFTWPSATLLLISQLSEPLALQITKPRTPVLILLDTDHTECQTSKVKTKQMNSLTSVFSHNTWAPEIYQVWCWPLSHSHVPLLRSKA